MFSMLLLLFVIPLTFSQAQQIIYTRPRPLTPLYPPVGGRRTVNDDSVRLPIARYFPEVDTEVESAPIQESYFPVADSYRLSADGLYAIPAQFVEQQRLAPVRSADDYFPGYDYESEYVPVYPSYADELYVQPQQELVEPDVFDDVGVNYLIRELQPNFMGAPEDTFEIQRRDRGSRQGVIPITSIMITSGKKPEFQGKLPSPQSSTASPSRMDISTDKPASTTVPPISGTTPSSQQTTSASSAVKVSPKLTESEIREGNGVWRSFSAADRGQKEFPLYRPSKSGQHSMWSSLEEQLSRVKNNNYKNPIPLMKKLLESHRGEADPLQDQLDSLKVHKL